METSWLMIAKLMQGFGIVGAFVLFVITAHWLGKQIDMFIDLLVNLKEGE